METITFSPAEQVGDLNQAAGMCVYVCVCFIKRERNRQRHSPAGVPLYEDQSVTNTCVGNVISNMSTT